MMGTDYTFHQGVQFCATLAAGNASTGIANVKSLTGVPDIHGFTLSAGWSRAAGFSIKLKTPADACIAFNGYKTKPIEVSMQTKPSPTLMVTAGLRVPVSGQEDPLEFNITLDASASEIAATGEMAGWWINPCGIGEHVKLGPNLALKVEFETGIPSGFGLRGGFAIGDTEGQCVVALSEVPTNEMIKADIKQLKLTDVIAFLDKMTGERTPQPSEELLLFEEVDLYVCPSGVTFGTITYPRGFSFEAKMVFYEKRIDISCNIDEEGIVVKGGIDNFELGPLKVRGTSGGRAVLDCEISKATQHVLVDGIVDFFDAEVVVHIEVSVSQTPTFKFHIQLSLGDSLSFLLHAELVGATSRKSLGDADFVFDTELDQNVLKFIRTQLLAHIKQARQGASEGIEAAKASLRHEDEAFNAKVDEAEVELREAFEKWDAKKREIFDAADLVMAAYEAEVEKLEGSIEEARGKYNDAMNAAERDMEKANHNREVAMAAARRDVEYARRQAVEDIEAAERRVDDAQRAVDLEFSHAIRGVEHARAAVQSVQQNIDDTYTNIHDLQNASGWEFWKAAAIPGLYAYIGTLEASKAVADTALRAAEGVLVGTNYVEKTTTLSTAHAALATAKFTADTAMQAAEGAVVTADEASREAVSDAVKVVEGVRTGVYYGILQGAILALKGYKELRESAYNEAKESIENVEECVEFELYHGAVAALEAARAGTVGIELAQHVLDGAHAASDAILDAAGAIVNALGTFDVRRVHVSGRLREIVDPRGKGENPLRVQADLMVLGEPRSFDVSLHPKDPLAMIADIFAQLWSSLGAP